MQNFLPNAKFLTSIYLTIYNIANVMHNIKCKQAHRIIDAIKDRDITFRNVFTRFGFLLDFTRFGLLLLFIFHWILNPDSF